jgi:uncharacterized protein involved in exopolysaccharide biosynthesis
MLEVIFRHRFVLGAPIVFGFALAPLLFWASQSTQYSSYASVWVERPTDLSGGSFTEFDPYVSPAQNQAASMGELLLINSFAARIVQGVFPERQATEEDILQLRRTVFFRAAGSHVLYISARSSDPAVAQRTVKAVVDEYSKLYRTQIKDRAERAKAFYKEQLTTARASLEAASADLQAYLARNPQMASVDLTDPPSSALRDTEFARLLSAEQIAQGHHQELLDKYSESQLSSNSADGASANFMVMDEPLLPTQPISPSKRAIVMPLFLGVGLGVSLSGGIFFLLWRLDRTVRLPQDIALAGLDIPVMTLPSLRSKRSWPAHFVRMAAAMSSGIRRPEPRAASD